jgi:hypothetical protein
LEWEWMGLFVCWPCLLPRPLRILCLDSL